MVVIYVPLNPESKYLANKQRSYVDDLVKEGWKNLGVVKLKDYFGTEIEVVALKNDLGNDFGNGLGNLGVTMDILDYVRVKIIDSNICGILDSDIIETFLRKHPMMKNSILKIDKRKDNEGFVKMIIIQDGMLLNKEKTHTLLWSIFPSNEFGISVKGME